MTKAFERLDSIFTAEPGEETTHEHKTHRHEEGETPEAEPEKEVE